MLKVQVTLARALSLSARQDVLRIHEACHEYGHVHQYCASGNSCVLVGKFLRSFPTGRHMERRGDYRLHCGAGRPPQLGCRLPIGAGRPAWLASGGPVGYSVAPVENTPIPAHIS